ncbi:hypothetical protein SAMN05216604_12837 [Pseudomonas agarici]|nr:hypothetical protein SAMN05216604_12837 [Pseudomonas agarici]
MTVSAPVFTYPPDRSPGMGPTPTIFGTGTPNSTVTIYETNTWNALGSTIVGADGAWAIGVTVPKQNPGAFNAFGAQATFQGETSGWATDLTLYV